MIKTQKHFLGTAEQSHRPKDRLLLVGILRLSEDSQEAICNAVTRHYVHEYDGLDIFGDGSVCATAYLPLQIERPHELG